MFLKKRNQKLQKETKYLKIKLNLGKKKKN